MFRIPVLRCAVSRQRVFHFPVAPMSPFYFTTGKFSPLPDRLLPNPRPTMTSPEKFRNRFPLRFQPFVTSTY